VKGLRIAYTADEMAWLEANRQMPIADYHVAFCEVFGRGNVSAQNLHALRKRKGWRTGRTGHFSRGSTPANKGQKCAPGVGGRHPNARATHFKKGFRGGVAARVYKPIGTERLSKSGYLERKINDDMPLQARWRAVHLIEWERAHGPIPAGHCLKCLDNDKTNLDPANWELISRGLMPRLNGGARKTLPAYDAVAPELRTAVLTAAKIDYAARQLRKRAPGTETDEARG